MAKKKKAKHTVTDPAKAGDESKPKTKSKSKMLESQLAAWELLELKDGDEMEQLTKPNQLKKKRK